MGIEGYRAGQHAVFKLQYHFVFVTKYRKPVLQDEIAEDTRSIIGRLIEENFEGSVLEMETDMDHIHILAELDTKYSIKSIANNLKGVSSRLVRKKHREELDAVLPGGSFWSDSYFVCTVGGAPLEVLKEYIESQPTKKRKPGRPW